MERTNFKQYFHERIRGKAFVVILIIYAAFLLFSGVYFFILWQVRNAIMSLAFLVFIPAIFLVEYFLHLRCGNIFTAAILALASGSILGTCYDVYTAFDLFDIILHGLAGVLFACLGFTLAEKFFGAANDKKRFFGCLLFAISFSLAIAVLWEIFEYTCTVLLGFDMMEDSIVRNIQSYLLAGSHNEVVTLDGITKTIVYYGNGKMFVIDGYLDLGLIDTLGDMIICTVGAAVFGGVATWSYFKAPKINKALIPKAL